MSMTSQGQSRPGTRLVAYYFVAATAAYVATGLATASMTARSAAQYILAAAAAVVFVAFTVRLSIVPTKRHVLSAALLSAGTITLAVFVVTLVGLLGFPGIVVRDSDPHQVVISSIYDLVLVAVLSLFAAIVVAICARWLSRTLD